MTTSYAGEDTEKLDQILQCIADVKWCSHSEKCLGVSSKAKHGGSIFLHADFITINVGEL